MTMRCFCLFCNDVALALTFSSSWLRRSLLQHARDDLSAACRYPFRYSVFGERKGHEEYLKSLNGQVKVCNDIRRYLGMVMTGYVCALKVCISKLRQWKRLDLYPHSDDDLNDQMTFPKAGHTGRLMFTLLHNRSSCPWLA